ncbi:MAG: sulfurtransferase TusA family protein [Pseudomonadales bacterium]|nr:sulfurtransferase TusA family protein [Pseudomonadales bacterium]
MSEQHVLDLKGLNRPMPLLKTKQALNQIDVGACLAVLTTDPGSVRDFKSFIDLTAHELVEFEARDREYYFVIRKGS